MVNHTVTDTGIVHTVKENPGPTASVQWRIRRPIPIDSDSFNLYLFSIIGADNRESGFSDSVSPHHAVCLQRLVNGKGMLVYPGNDSSRGGMKPTGAVVPDTDPISHLKTSGAGQGDLLFSVITIGGKQRDEPVCFL